MSEARYVYTDRGRTSYVIVQHPTRDRWAMVPTFRGGWDRGQRRRWRRFRGKAERQGERFLLRIERRQGIDE